MTIDDTVQSILNAPTDSVSINQLPTGVPGWTKFLAAVFPNTAST